MRNATSTPVRASMPRAPWVLLLLPAACTTLPAPLLAQTWSTLQASRRIEGESRLNVEVKYGTGSFRVEPASNGQLYAVNLKYDEDVFTPVHQFEDSRLVVGVEKHGSVSVFHRGAREGELRLALTDQVPMDLDLEFGAVEADMELGGMRLRSLSLSTGASDATLRVSTPNPEAMRSMELHVGAASLHANDLGRLNAESVTLEAGVGDVSLDFGGLERATTQVTAKMGVGSLEIRIPREAGIRLTRQSFLTALEAPGLERQGDEYITSNWDSSSNRVFIDVEAALGKVSIVRSN